MYHYFSTKLKDNFAFDLYFCEIHLKKVLKENDIEIDEFDDNKN
ncbi:hypothetical protein [Spiroplasma endosymbiont of Amphimallon solstitiale]